MHFPEKIMLLGNYRSLICLPFNHWSLNKYHVIDPSLTERGKNERITRGTKGQLPDVHMIVYEHKHYVTDVGLESSVLFTRHIQCGHGNEYRESFGLLSSTPFKTLWARIFSNCRFKLFHLKSKSNGIWWNYKAYNTYYDFKSRSGWRLDSSKENTGICHVYVSNSLNNIFK